MPHNTKQNESMVIRGSVVKVRRSCGKSQCKCAKGELHQTWALSYSHQGRTRMIALRDEDVPIVRKAIYRYREAMKKLESQALQGIRRLHAAIKAAKRRRR